ncbi:carbohydrate ABC transporter permease [Phycicoccus endophyticus]|uniref:Carbohydrate ABC transporter permease n=1 Tax=Phycicoccus endophyticus TaxID=1690220 RepID=A0A7G9QYP1_9MICO|nr:carbohydrate ABC transporter permease [Phycicoccus endophyticus]NHI20498.1 carbohydrate ABC transporter permease [Phycicoccus endophyticus]QNN48466.1 carbohydrate ABC transporter permease [Phycicoccus endophyticus]GGL30249.1 sugar ABC transporter permease [Phycicoccus endophyticus]
MAVVAKRPQDRAAAAVRYTVLVLAALLFLLPFALLARNALTLDQDLNNPEWHWFPPTWAWSNLTDLFTNPELPMARSLVNSLLIAVTQTAGVLVLSGMAGYGLARIPYRWSNAVFYTITATLLIPAAVTFVPSFVLVSTLGWISTLRGLIIPGLFQALATFLFRQFFLSFPKEVEEAAFLDGLSYWGTFWRVVVPNSLGFTAAIGTITFIQSWNAFLWPLVIGRSQEAWTVQVALSTFLTAQSVDFGQLFMGALVAIAPLLLMFVFLQRWIVEGVERSGIGGD